jgi:hypothetical protein
MCSITLVFGRPTKITSDLYFGWRDRPIMYESRRANRSRGSRSIVAVDPSTKLTKKCFRSASRYASDTLGSVDRSVFSSISLMIFSYAARRAARLLARFDKMPDTDKCGQADSDDKNDEHEVAPFFSCDRQICQSIAPTKERKHNSGNTDCYHCSLREATEKDFSKFRQLRSAVEHVFIASNIGFGSRRVGKAASCPNRKNS